MSLRSLQKRDKWCFFLILTLALNLASAFLFPMLVTDAFTPRVFIVSVIPVIWGFSVLFLYRSNREKYVAWLALVGAAYWLIPTIGLPIEFIGR